MLAAGSNARAADPSCASRSWARSVATSSSRTACTSTTRSWTCCSPRARPSPTARGPTSGSDRGSPAPAVTPTWWSGEAESALGCDSENAGDQIDVLRAAALAAGLAKDVRGDPTRFGAREAFALATIAGAEAIGLGSSIGSLEVGKRADLVVHDTTGPTFRPPGGDPYLQLVWGTDGRSVRHVVVDGTVVVRDGRCVLFDEEALAREARGRAVRLRAAAGVGPR